MVNNLNNNSKKIKRKVLKHRNTYGVLDSMKNHYVSLVTAEISQVSISNIKTVKY